MDRADDATEYYDARRPHFALNTPRLGNYERARPARQRDDRTADITFDAQDAAKVDIALDAGSGT